MLVTVDNLELIEWKIDDSDNFYWNLFDDVRCSSVIRLIPTLGALELAFKFLSKQKGPFGFTVIYASIVWYSAAKSQAQRRRERSRQAEGRKGRKKTKRDRIKAKGGLREGEGEKDGRASGEGT